MSKFAEKYTGVYNPRLKERDDYWDMLKAERETKCRSMKWSNVKRETFVDASKKSSVPSKKIKAILTSGTKFH